MNVPSKLRDEAINFCLVEKPVQGERSSGKKPFQPNWPNLNLKWDNENLTNWLGMNGNYGVIGGGEKNLVIIDFDDVILQNELEPKLPETFTVKTGSGLLHKYYFTDGGKSFKILDDKGDTRADIQSDGKQVVGPGSKHFTGNMYELVNNAPIATMKFEDIKNLLTPYNTFKKNKSVANPAPISPQQKRIFTTSDDFQDDLFRSVTFESLLSEFGVDTSKNPTNCPFHDSKGGQCLGFEEDRAHCFHCEGAWNKISWIKENKNCDAKEAIEWLAEREGRLTELEESRERWKLEKVREDMKKFAEEFAGEEKGEVDDFKEKKVNWTDEKISWEDMREKVRMIIQNAEKMFMVCSNKDTIKGKPQLVHTTKKKITLVRLTEKESGKKGEEEKTQRVKFLDEAIDKRSDGVILDSWSEDFWVYRTISNNVEYFLLSEKEMPIQGCIIQGMKMEVNDMAEMNQSLRVKSLSNLFFVHSFEPSVKIISKEEIVAFTKERGITERIWTDFLDYHPLNTRNRFPYMANMLRSAHILSGRKHKWPLHVGVIGPAGTRKSMGYIETIAHKFQEDAPIVEGGNSRIKGLSPSFKEKPANIGYLAKCERMGFIDELGKMIEFESNRHDAQVNNVLGELNFLLDHKKRTVGSGNDNECVVQANSKFLFVSNPVRKKRYLKEHIGTVDPTTMSRVLWWIQNKDEQDFVIGPKGVEEVGGDVKDIFRLEGELPPKIKDIQSPEIKDIQNSKNDEITEKDKLPKSKDILFTHKVVKDINPPHTNKLEEYATTNTKNKKPILCVCECGGECVFTREEYLTLFDTVNSFLCNIDSKEVERLNQIVVNLAQDKLKDIWKPRGPHHIELIIDGFIKHRCLFRDYDATFKAKDEDYKLAEAFLLEMANRWDTDLSMGVQGGW